MTEQEFNKAIEQGNVDFVQPAPESPAEEVIKPLTEDDYQAVLEAIRRPKRYLTAAPTFVPKNFTEQIQFVDDGSDKSLYVYINGEWRQIPVSSNAQTATGTSSITISDLDLDANYGYEFTVLVDGSAAHYVKMRMNGDTGTNYAHQMKQTEDNTTDGITDGDILWLQHSTAGIRATNSLKIWMTRPGAGEPVVVSALSTGIGANDTTIPVTHYMGGTYNSASNITSVEFSVSTGTANWRVFVKRINQ